MIAFGLGMTLGIPHPYFIEKGSYTLYLTQSVLSFKNYKEKSKIYYRREGLYVGGSEMPQR